MNKQDYNQGIIIRSEIKPGDVGSIIHMHGKLYAQEHGFNLTFEAYVAGPLSEFIKDFNPANERLWMVEKENEVVGSIAIVKFSDEQAQLRWLLLHPDVRGRGIGKKLVEDAIAFARKCGYSSIFLWTVDILPQAAHIYRSYGFKITEEKRNPVWGLEMTEQKYELKL